MEQFSGACGDIRGTGSAVIRKELISLSAFTHGKAVIGVHALVLRAVHIYAAAVRCVVAQHAGPKDRVVLNVCAAKPAMSSSCVIQMGVRGQLGGGEASSASLNVHSDWSGRL